MLEDLTRRSILKLSSAALAAQALPREARAFPHGQSAPDLIHLNLNENAFGASPKVEGAIRRELPNVARYADAASAGALAEQIAAYEHVAVEQVVLGEILVALGLYLGATGGPGGEFIYSTPGYLALIDAASHVGGIGVPVPLNARYENDLPALLSSIHPKTRALYLINPHNPTGTLNEDASFKKFLREASQHAPTIVDEAYLEYSPDFSSRSAVSLVRDGADVLVFRTFDKIHGLAGLPIGYTLTPLHLAKVLRAQGLGDAEELGRLNIAAASAALSDTDHVLRVRSSVASERSKWNAVLDELKLPHTKSATDFVFFDAGRPQTEIAARMRAQGVDVGRTFAPYVSWVRITIGLPEENLRAQRALRVALQS